MAADDSSRRAPHREDVDLPRLATSLVTNSNDAIMAVDTDGRIMVWNKAAEQLFGWTAQEVLGRTPARLLPEDRLHELLHVTTALEGVPETASLETVRLHRSGRPLPVSRRTSPLFDEAGAVIGVSAIFRDISREIALREELERTRRLAEARFHDSDIAQATLSLDGRILDVNRALCELSGYGQNELLGRPTTDFIPERELAAAASLLSQLSSGERDGSRHPRLLRRADGHVVETRISVFVVRDGAGRPERIEATVDDVSEAAAAARELQLRESRWQSLVASSADVAFFCGPNAEVLFVSPSLHTQFGYEPDEVLGSIGFSFGHPEDEPAMRAEWEATAVGPAGTTTEFEGRVRHADGSWRWVEVTLTNRLDEPGIEAIVANLNDITERKSAQAVLEEFAGMDALTGLPTRSPLLSALDAAFAADLAAQTAVGVVDIARFKLVNDTFGQRGGDELLVEVAGRLLAAARDRGAVARIGGDRFAVMLRDHHEISDVFESFAGLLAEVERPVQLGERTHAVTAAVGVALGPAVDSGALLASAETALVTAKLGLTGPMHVVRAESSSASIFQARLIEDLRRGIEQDELVVHFQPVVTVSDGRPVAAEALVRWNHPDKGLLSPAAFIDAAEASGLIVPIGQKVLQEACRRAAAWASLRGRESFHVSVNLSAKQLIGSDVVNVVREALSTSGASPGNLMLEVTESAVMSDVEAAVQTLQTLRQLGVSVAVDDFGTGYSSLTYLKQFPVTALKIDRSFVSGLGQNRDDAAIVSSVINLARSMELDCIAEGVETEQHRTVLQALGCTHAQGYLWSPAMDSGTFDAWLGEGDVQKQPLGRAAAGSAEARPRGGGSPTPSAQVLHRVEELSRAGASLHTIAAALNADQLQTGARRRWTSHSVAALLAARPST